MTPRFRLALLCATMLLCGCDHHRSTAENQPAVRGDSDLTGIPAQPLDSVVKIPPRATLVALPPGYNPPPPPPISDASTNVAENSPPPSAPPPPQTAPASSSAPPAIPPVDSTPAMADADVPGSSSLPPSSGNSADSTATSSDTPASPAADQSKLIVIQTSQGRIVMELDDFAAPKTCKNFRQLVADGFYNNTVFHRVIPNFIIQGGDPNSKSSATSRDTYGLGGPGYTIPAEINLKHDRGAVAMARLPDSVNPNRDSNGSQFYICLAPAPSLDDQYTVFGHVVQGMDVADKISESPRDGRDNPLSRVEMNVSLQSKEQALLPGPAANP